MTQNNQYFSYFFITYDIADPTRLRKTAEIIKKYLNRRERSVYDGNLSPARLKQLRKEIEQVIELSEDHCTIIPLTELCKKNIQIIGKPLFDYDYNSGGKII